MRKLFLRLVLLILISAGFLAYLTLESPNVNSDKRVSLKIPTGSSYAAIIQLLQDNKVLKNGFTFSIVSRLKHYPEQVKSGYYVFNRNMNNRQIVNMLRLGLQTPVTLVIYNIRTKDEFAGLAGRTLEIDSTLLLSKLNDPEFCAESGLDTNNILTRFIVDNYELYWNTPLNKFLDKMNTAYNDFWNEKRKEEAEAIRLSPAQVIILASIVEKEAVYDTELPIIAGVYLNRLKAAMPLQADPTLVFALRDFGARRVNSWHKDFDSPYNTYLHAGLPPGPICMPRKKSIDAVLNAEQNGYLYFCANPDMSGYSLFSKTYDEQKKNAALYRKKLNEMNVH